MNAKIKITPENIQELKSNEIFVFGANLGGFHGGGATIDVFDDEGNDIYRNEINIF